MKHFLLIAILLFIQVTAFAQTKAADYTEQGKITVEEQVDNLELKVFPNPVKNSKVTLEMESDQMAEIRLVNIVGKEVLKKNFEFGINKYQMQLDNVPKGIYLVQVKTLENKAVVKKLLISDD